MQTGDDSDDLDAEKTMEQNENKKLRRPHFREVT